MNLFIDTNLFLNFYHFSSDDLEELEKLIVLISNEKIRLILPEQVKDEFYRNREVKLKDAMKLSEGNWKQNKIPQFYKNYQEYQEIISLSKELSKKFSKLKEKVNSEIDSRRLKADDLIGTLFSIGDFVERSKDLIDKSILRFNIGNPPGKNKSYGDAINWEALLEEVPQGEPLYFLSDDKDYFSKINTSQIDPFLLDEWREKKKSEIFPFRSFSSFFSSKFPKIKLALELEKEIRMNKLVESGSFASARRAMWNVSELNDYPPELVESFLEACVQNSQIFWISEDEDINNLIYDFIGNHESNISSEKLIEFKSQIPKINSSEEF